MWRKGVIQSKIEVLLLIQGEAQTPATGQLDVLKAELIDRWSHLAQSAEEGAAEAPVEGKTVFRLQSKRGFVPVMFILVPPQHGLASEVGQGLQGYIPAAQLHEILKGQSVPPEQWVVKLAIGKCTNLPLLGIESTGLDGILPEAADHHSPTSYSSRGIIEDYRDGKDAPGSLLCFTEKQGSK